MTNSITWGVVHLTLGAAVLQHYGMAKLRRLETFNPRLNYGLSSVGLFLTSRLYKIQLGT